MTEDYMPLNNNTRKARLTFRSDRPEQGQTRMSKPPLSKRSISSECVKRNLTYKPVRDLLIEYNLRHHQPAHSNEPVCYWNSYFKALPLP